MSAALLLGVFAPAAVLHGMVGIGFPLITTAALALFMPMPQAVALTLLPTLLLNLTSLLPLHSLPAVIRRYALLALASVVGSLLGVYLLLILPAAWLQLALALATGFYVLHSLRRDLPAPPRGLPATLLLGLLAGVVGGATNAMSSILMMVLLAQSRDRHEIAQTANLCFALSKLVQLVVLWPVLQTLPLGWAMMGALCLVAIIGLLAGLALRQRMAFRHFRLLCLLVLSVLALLMGWRGLQGVLG